MMNEAVATESGGDETRDETGGPGDETGDAGDETTATGGVMYTDEGELEFDEDEMAAFRCGIVSRFRV